MSETSKALPRANSELVDQGRAHGPLKARPKQLASIAPAAFNSPVITMRPAVEVMRLNAVPLWHFAQRDPLSWLVLHAACTDDEVGLFLALLADRYGS